MLNQSKRLSIPAFAVLCALLCAPLESRQIALGFARGDVLVSIEQGPVLWFLPDGTPRGVLVPTVVGVGEGMGWDSAGNLYISRWSSDPFAMTGNTVEKFSAMGVSQGAVGSGYNCAPHTIVFDAADTAYVGQAGCTKSLLKFRAGMSAPTEYPAAEDVQGIFWMDLAPDGCTLFYTSYGANVKRIDGCTGTQLPDFNAAPVPGGVAHDLRVLPDGGALVSTGEVISRFDSSGTVVQTYRVIGPATYWVGLDLVGDGTFWVADYFGSTVYRFDLATGAVVDSFSTGTPANSVVGVRVKR